MGLSSGFGRLESALDPLGGAFTEAFRGMQGPEEGDVVTLCSIGNEWRC